MEGLEKIRQQLCLEAAEEGRRIEEQALQQKQAVVARAQERADAEYKQVLAETCEQQQRRRAQLKAQLRMDERRALLETKQDWIRRVMQEALRQLAARPAEEKVEDCLRLLGAEELRKVREAAPGEPVRITLCEADAALAEPLRARLPFAAEVRADGRGFASGLLVSVGAVHFNYSYEESMRHREAEFIGRIGHLLFA